MDKRGRSMTDNCNKDENDRDKLREAVGNLGYVAGHTTNEVVKGGLIGTGIGGAVTIGHALVRRGTSVSNWLLVSILSAGALVGSAVGIIRAFSAIGQEKVEAKAKTSALPMDADELPEIPAAKQTNGHVKRLNGKRQEEVQVTHRTV